LNSCGSFLSVLLVDLQLEVWKPFSLTTSGRNAISKESN
jgi:hypothetical protein